MLADGLPSHSGTGAFVEPISLLLAFFCFYLALKPGGKFYFGKWASKDDRGMPNRMGRLVFLLAGVGSVFVFLSFGLPDAQRIGYLAKTVQWIVYVIWAVVGLAWLRSMVQSGKKP